MSAYFLDTSALVKRYAAEAGHAWVADLCDPAHGHELYISQAALVEVVAAFCRKAREGGMTVPQRDQLIDDFRRDYLGGYAVKVVSAATYLRAGDLCRAHKLRGYDAVQLTCALEVRDEALAASMPAPLFVCADTDLLNVARAEGFASEDPNSYP